MNHSKNSESANSLILDKSVIIVLSLSLSLSLSCRGNAFETFGVLTEEESKEEYLLDNRLPREAPHQIWGHWMCFENKGVHYRCRRIANGRRKQNLITGFEIVALPKPVRFELSVVHTKDDCIGYIAEIKSHIGSNKHFCAFGNLFDQTQRMDFYKVSRVKSKKGLWTFPATEP